MSVSCAFFQLGLSPSNLTFSISNTPGPDRGQCLRYQAGLGPAGARVGDFAGQIAPALGQGEVELNCPLDTRCLAFSRVVRLLLVVPHRPMNRSSPQAEPGAAETQSGFSGFRGGPVSRSKSSCKQMDEERKGDGNSLGGPLPRP
ncbi:hypothetical protein PAL_GLEAN10004654 [Pteropus alecto]|uniref:Uncharacterized protein n=1 Tax=Pteropus alecto TaxID=9402 RepID=L5JYS8_PTEAL|nr:hypothetical protein PAL_GLEAN10004654 [Pteropus alecto]